jgi:UDP-N-acetyl-D-mannosaminuronic acid dehydrogenase
VPVCRQAGREAQEAEQDVLDALVKRRLGGSLRERKVAVLGLAFKRDTVDERDSLAHKLVRLLERELADVAVHDPMVTTPSASFEQAIEDADVVIVATNHSVLERPEALAAIADRAKADCLVVDPWNALGAAQVFAYANEIAALRA